MSSRSLLPSWPAWLVLLLDPACAEEHPGTGHHQRHFRRPESATGPVDGYRAALPVRPRLTRRLRDIRSRSA